MGESSKEAGGGSPGMRGKEAKASPKQADPWDMVPDDPASPLHMPTSEFDAEAHGEFAGMDDHELTGPASDARKDLERLRIAREIATRWTQESNRVPARACLQLWRQIAEIRRARTNQAPGKRRTVPKFKLAAPVAFSWARSCTPDYNHYHDDEADTDDTVWMSLMAQADKERSSPVSEVEFPTPRMSRRQPTKLEKLKLRKRPQRETEHDRMQRLPPEAIVPIEVCSAAVRPIEVCPAHFDKRQLVTELMPSVHPRPESAIRTPITYGELTQMGQAAQRRRKLEQAGACLGMPSAISFARGPQLAPRPAQRAPAPWHYFPSHTLVKPTAPSLKFSQQIRPL